MNLDKIDKQILEILFENGRESLQSIGNSVQKENRESMSHTGVNKRINKLERNDFLKIQGNINIQKLNYKSCFILLEMENFDAINNIMEAYSECPRVFLLTQISGRFNLIMGIVGQNSDVLQRYINFCGPTNKEGILHSEVLFVADLKVPKYIPLNLFTRESKECICGNVCKNCAAFLDGKCAGCGNF
jgi:DNA-binding Lrp family transcriptional regulator